jgi:hypothetical protein
MAVEAFKTEPPSAPQFNLVNYSNGSPKKMLTVMQCGKRNIRNQIKGMSKLRGVYRLGQNGKNPPLLLRGFQFMPQLLFKIQIKGRKSDANMAKGIYYLYSKKRQRGKKGTQTNSFYLIFYYFLILHYYQHQAQR